MGRSDTLDYHVRNPIYHRYPMKNNEPRNSRNNWQMDYNKWWHRKNGTPVEEDPVLVGTERINK
jgi:hypothetical protein